MWHFIRILDLYLYRELHNFMTVFWFINSVKKECGSVEQIPSMYTVLFFHLILKSQILWCFFPAKPFYPFASLIHGYPLPLLRLKWTQFIDAQPTTYTDWSNWIISEMIFYHLSTPTHLHACLFVEYCRFITCYLFLFLGFHSSTICRLKVPREQLFTILIC